MKEKPKLWIGEQAHSLPQKKFPGLTEQCESWDLLATISVITKFILT